MARFFSCKLRIQTQLYINTLHIIQESVETQKQTKMCLKRTSLVLYIIIHLQHNFSSVSSRSSSVDTYHESLPLRAIKPDIVGFEGKTQELAVVIKKEVVA